MVAALAARRLPLVFINESRKVYTEIVANVQKKTLQQIIRSKVSLDSVIHSDMRRGYNGLVDVGYGKHLRINHIG